MSAKSLRSRSKQPRNCWAVGLDFTWFTASGHISLANPDDRFRALISSAPVCEVWVWMIKHDYELFSVAHIISSGTIICTNVCVHTAVWRRHTVWAWLLNSWPPHTRARLGYHLVVWHEPSFVSKHNSKNKVTCYSKLTKPSQRITPYLWFLSLFLNKTNVTLSATVVRA